MDNVGCLEMNRYGMSSLFISLAPAGSFWSEHTRNVIFWCKYHFFTVLSHRMGIDVQLHVSSISM